MKHTTMITFASLCVAMVGAPSALAALPAEYQQLEYIASSGAQRIKTGVTPTATDTIEMRMRPLKLGATQCLWCSRGKTTTTGTFTTFQMDSNMFRLDRNATAGTETYSLSLGRTYTVVANGSTLATTITDELTGESATGGTLASGSFTVGSPLGLFASHYNGVDANLGNWGTYRLYSFKVTATDSSVRCELVPARRVADGVLGLYDTKNSTFLTNAGTGSFTAGPAVANTYTWIGGASGNLSTAANWSPAPAGAFTADDKLLFTSAATVAVDADATVGTIAMDSAAALTFTGANTLTVTEIDNLGAEATFSCPVQFAGTYRVTSTAAQVKFPGGATATYPDNEMRVVGSTAYTRTLDGDFTFTSDWIVNNLGNVGDYPWIVPASSTVRGQNFSGSQASHKSILRIDEGGYACFTTVTNGWDRGDIDIDGLLEATREIIVRTNPSGGSTGSNFGRSGNIGTLKAPRIAKCEHANALSYIPNLIVGAGGFGSLTQDYSYRLEVDTTVTATDDFEFLGNYRSTSAADWGVNLNSHQLTINVPEGKTVTCGIGLNTAASTVRKTGAGTLVMTDTFNGQSGFAKIYANGTFIDEGTVRLAANGQLGTGPVTIASGARLEIADGVSVSNQIDGEGTLALGDGVALTMGTVPWGVGAVEVASGASISVTNAIPGAFAFLTGVNPADVASFSFGNYPLTVAGDTLCYAGGAAAGAYVWNGADGADWAVAGNWLVGGAVPATAPASTDTVIFQNASPVTVGGTGALTVTKIVTLSDDLVTFGCPVQFAGTYLVENAAVAPLFAGGATATHPDVSLTEMNVSSHALNGVITFTEDWTIPLQPAGRPFVIAENSVVRGKVLSAETYSNTQPDLRIDPGAVATFDTVEVGGKLVFWLNGGKLVATGDVHLGGDATGRDFGYYGQPNTGTLEAHGIYKNVTSVGLIYHYITNMVVGAGGFGMYRKDYTIRFERDVRLTAKDDLAIHQPIASDGPKDGDWGLNLYGHTFTIDTAGHTVTFDSWVSATASTIVKEGEGEMIMQSRVKQHTGGTILNGGLTTVKLAGALGYGTATVNDGATLRFADTVTSFAYPIVVNAGGTFEYAAGVTGSSTLTLAAGATLKPAQGAVFSVPDGNLTLPDEGMVTVDLRDFSLVNGVASAILGGVAAGDEAKFTALVPAGVNGAFSVSGGILFYTPTAGGSAAADLFWHPVDDAVWSTSVAAWTNAAGSQVTFTPYANATIADTATISLPEDVPGNDVTVAADGDVTLTGAGTLGGVGTVTKRGSGTLTLDGANFDGQNFTIAEGKVVLGDNAGAHALGTDSGSVGGTVTVQDGGQFNVNTQNTTGNATDERFEITHLKTFVIAGDGPDGRGAIVNDSLTGITSSWGPALRRVELADDATIGGANRYDVRVRTGTAATSQGGIFGPGKQLTVKCPGFFGLIGLPIDVGSVLITDGGVFRPEGVTSISIPGGITLDNGTLHAYNTTYPAEVPIYVTENCGSINAQSGTTTFNGPIAVANEATLNLEGDSYTVNYSGGITNNGAVAVSGGTHAITGGELAGDSTFTVSAGTLKLNPSTIIGAPSLAMTGGTLWWGMGDAAGFPNAENVNVSGITSGLLAFHSGAASATVPVQFASAQPNDIKFYNSDDNQTITIPAGNWTVKSRIGVANGSYPCHLVFGNGANVCASNLAVAIDSSAPKTAIVEIGPGSTLTLSDYARIGEYSGASEYWHEVIVNGGTFSCANVFAVAYDSPLCYATLSSGRMSVGGLNVRSRTSYIYDNTDERFTMTGGELDLGASGLTTARMKYTNTHVNLQGGLYKAAADHSVGYYGMLVATGEDMDAPGELTIDLNGKTVTHSYTPHFGSSAVTLTGAGSYVTSSEFQGIVKGKWTVDTAASATVNLTGFAGFAGGLELKDGTSASLGISGESAVEYVFLRGTGFDAAYTYVTNNGAFPSVASHMQKLSTPYGSNQGPVNSCSFAARGQFYVPEDDAGTWTFAGNYDDNVGLWVDGTQVFVHKTYNTVGQMQAEMTAGWHDFIFITYDGTGSQGPYVSDWKSAAMCLGWVKGTSASTSAADYNRFDTSTLRMRVKKPITADGVTVERVAGNYSSLDALRARDNWSPLWETNSLQKVLNTKIAQQQTSSMRITGGFLVDEEHAGEWTLYGSWDDRIIVKFDGVEVLNNTAYNKLATSTVKMTPGWHAYEIRVGDGTGGYGPDAASINSGYGFAVMRPGDTAKQPFDERTFTLTTKALVAQLAERPGLGGVTTVGAGATLANGSPWTGTNLNGRFCPIYGTLKGSGTLSGPYRFTGDDNSWEVTDALVHNATLPCINFTDATPATFAGLKSLSVTFDGKPSRRTYYLTTATVADLTAEDLAGTVLTVKDADDNDYSANFTLTMKNGRLALSNSKPAGTFIIVR